MSQTEIEFRFEHTSLHFPTTHPTQPTHIRNRNIWICCYIARPRSVPVSAPPEAQCEHCAGHDNLSRLLWPPSCHFITAPHSALCATTRGYFPIQARTQIKRPALAQSEFKSWGTIHDTEDLHNLSRCINFVIKCVRCNCKRPLGLELHCRISIV